MGDHAVNAGHLPEIQAAAGKSIQESMKGDSADKAEDDSK